MRGVRNDDLTKELAYDIRERIELLTSIIGGPPDVTRASTAHAVLAELIESIGVLERAFHLLDQFIQHELAAGRLNSNPGMTPEQWARVAAGALDDAQQDARRLQFSLFDARAAIGELQTPSPPPVTAGRDFPAPISDALQADQSQPGPAPKPDPATERSRRCT